jgi:hypothetical protein
VKPLYCPHSEIAIMFVYGSSGWGLFLRHDGRKLIYWWETDDSQVH